MPDTTAPPAKDATQNSAKPHLVFLSHDSRDSEIAEAFSNLISETSMAMLASFRSSDNRGSQGIEFGDEWYRVIMQKLEEADDVVAILTTNSLERPWILYEVGVAKGRKPSVAFGLAIGVPLGDASKGPFGQFQNCADDPDSLTKLVKQLIGRIPGASPSDAVVRGQVAAFKESVDKILKKSPKKTAVAKPEEELAARLLEEVKSAIRDTRLEISGLRDSSAAGSIRRGRRFRSEMVLETLFSCDSCVTALAAMSPYRDEMPVVFMIFEVGVQFQLKNDVAGLKSLLAAIPSLRNFSFDFRGAARDLVPDYMELQRHAPMYLDVATQVIERTVFQMNETIAKPRRKSESSS